MAEIISPTVEQILAGQTKKAQLEHEGKVDALNQRINDVLKTYGTPHQDHSPDDAFIFLTQVAEVEIIGPNPIIKTPDIPFKFSGKTGILHVEGIVDKAAKISVAFDEDQTPEDFESNFTLITALYDSSTIGHRIITWNSWYIPPEQLSAADSLVTDIQAYYRAMNSFATPGVV